MTRKREQINLRVTQNQKEMIQQKAELSGLSVSSFLINCASKCRVEGYAVAKKVPQNESSNNNTFIENDDFFDNEFMKF